MRSLISLSRRRAILRRSIRVLQGVFARAEVHGVENIPPHGPLLILFNHLSTLDGPLVMANMPGEIELVGPGDFPMTAAGQLVIRAYGITLINRGRADRASLRAVVDHLRAGRMVAMAPDGGTWEKGITDVKEGAAYLSQLTQTPMLPVGLGGLYRVPVPGLMALLSRPRITITFGEVMPPVPPSADRRRREADLRAASLAIMRRIYDLLPPEDRARYDAWGRAIYDLRLDFAAENGTPIVYNGPPLPDLSALGEFLAKPNLFRPMWQNARLVVDPFREGRFFPAMEVRLAARDLVRTLTAGAFDVYLQYRLGNARAGAALAALQALRDEICEWALQRGARLRLTPVIRLPEECDVQPDLHPSGVEGVVEG